MVIRFVPLSLVIASSTVGANHKEQWGLLFNQACSIGSALLKPI